MPSDARCLDPRQALDCVGWIAVGAHERRGRITICREFPAERGSLDMVDARGHHQPWESPLADRSSPALLFERHFSPAIAAIRAIVTALTTVLARP